MFWVFRNGVFLLRFGSLIHQLLQLPNLLITEVIKLFFCELDSKHSLFSWALLVVINLLPYQRCIVLWREDTKVTKMTRVGFLSTSFNTILPYYHTLLHNLWKPTNTKWQQVHFFQKELHNHWRHKDQRVLWTWELLFAVFLVDRLSCTAPSESPQWSSEGKHTHQSAGSYLLLSVIHSYWKKADKTK